ncbi:MAG: penicillin-binding protein 2 [Austwickia sp.]|nr:penicillin-binding protein 2 [Austwickia sp.]MBK8435741.1 penicillin-binding protein 2 [Austwickia sp.]MBK9100698.1 penicillin-binding protein 2 [Austwickia sp.]
MTPTPNPSAPPRRPPARLPAGSLANGRRRVRTLFIVVLFVFSLFVAQLLRLQGFDAQEIAAKGIAIRLVPTPLPAPRGNIVDRFQLPLATSMERRTVIADPWTLRDYARFLPGKKVRSLTKVGVRGAAEDLAPLLGKDVDELERLMTPKQMPEGTPDKKQDRYRVVAKGLDPNQWRVVREAAIPGISSEITSQRAYPAGAPTAALLGNVGSSGKAAGAGGWGLEAQYDKLLVGTPGKVQRELSGDGRTIPLGDNRLVEPVPGRDLSLTIDRDLTWFAYNAIAAQVRKYKALNGTVVIMDRQGRVLTMAQYPTFDPADLSIKGSVLRNLSVEDIFEPGSTAKVMSIGAALAEGVITPTSPFTVPDKLGRGGKVLHDSHSHPTEQLTAAGILAQSSNVGTMLIAEQLASQKLEDYFRAFGAGSTSGLKFPSESAGILAPSQKWSSSQRFTVMYGQGMAMTAIQTASVFQTIANGGVRIPPTVVAGWTRQDGSFEEQPKPEGIRVIPAKTAGELTVMLEAVVGEGGTAKNAMIPGYRVAGKTGTSQRYEKSGGYTASFIGFAPAENPQYIVAVTVQRPQGAIYGGVVAGPVFRQIMAYALAKGGVAPSEKLPKLYPLAVGKDAPTVAWARDWEEAQAENRRNQVRTDDPARSAAAAPQADIWGMPIDPATLDPSAFEPGPDDAETFDDPDSQPTSPSARPSTPAKPSATAKPSSRPSATATR